MISLTECSVCSSIICNELPNLKPQQVKSPAGRLMTNSLLLGVGDLWFIRNFSTIATPGDKVWQTAKGMALCVCGSFWAPLSCCFHLPHSIHAVFHISLMNFISTSKLSLNVSLLPYLMDLNTEDSVHMIQTPGRLDIVFNIKMTGLQPERVLHCYSSTPWIGALSMSLSCKGLFKLQQLQELLLRVRVLVIVHGAETGGALGTCTGKYNPYQLPQMPSALYRS